MRIGVGLSVPELATRGGKFSPASLFSGGTAGVWYDPSDYSTLFQDSAGTTPVTAVEQPVGKMLDKSGNGNHASQATAASRPVLRARYNLLTYSNQADNAAWTKSNSFVQTNLLLQSQTFDTAAWSKTTASVTADTAIAPDGTLTADTITATSVGANTGFINQSVTLAASTNYVYSVYVKHGTESSVQLQAVCTVGATNSGCVATFNITSGTASAATSYGSITGATASITSAANGYYRCILVMPVPAGVITNGATWFYPYAGSDAANTYAYAWGAQLVQGSVPGDYRATTSAALPVLYADYNGALRARKLCEDATATVIHRCTETATMPLGPCTASVYAKAGERTKLTIDLSDNSTGDVIYNFDLSAGTASSGGSAGSWTGLTGNILSLGNGWYRCLITGVRGAGAQTVMSIITANAAGSTTYTGDGSSGIYIADAQVVTGSVPGNYQNINAATDYNTAGFLPYLALDGTDDSFGTNSINFSATDKMSVCAGVTKLADSAGAIAYELSADVNTNAGTFLLAPQGTGASAGYVIGSRGSNGIGLLYATGTTYAAPITNVVTATHNISGDSTILRVNGSQVATNTNDQGTGNFGSYPLYIGRRNNASLPFNGRIYQMVVCGKALSASELAALESFTNARTGAY